MPLTTGETTRGTAGRRRRSRQNWATGGGTTGQGSRLPIPRGSSSLCRVLRTAGSAFRPAAMQPAGGYKGFGSFHSDNVEELVALSDAEFSERCPPFPFSLSLREYMARTEPGREGSARASVCRGLCALPSSPIARPCYIHQAEFRACATPGDRAARTGRGTKISIPTIHTSCSSQ